MVYIVLPPELSKRSIQTLIQYMYSGEATVSNDILNEVLRGGEVLKIRGLWRNNQSSEPNASSTPQFQPSGNVSSSLKMGDGVPFCPPLIPSAKENPVNTDVSTNKSIYEHQHQQHQQNQQQHRPDRPGTTAVIKESPVIVMSPRQSMPSNHSQSLPASSATGTAQGGLVKMEMAANETANDPTIPPAHYGLVSLQIAAAVKKAQQTSEKRSKPGPTPMKATHHENGSDPLRRYSDEQPLRCDLVDATAPIHHRALRDSDILRMTDKRRMSVAVTDSRQNAVHHLDPGEKSRSTGRIVLDKKPHPQQQQPQQLHLMSTGEVNIPEALSFLTIKQEPLEWAEYDHENGIEKSQIEVTVKPEIPYADGGDTEDEGMKNNVQV